jgi:hypothetical protein
MYYAKAISLLVCLFLFSCTLAEAQFRKGVDEPISVYQRKNRHRTFSISAGAAFSSYYGDLKDSRIDFWAKPSAQLGLQYRVNDHFHFRAELIWYRISGADSLNKSNSGIYDRNLSFRADNFELNLVGLMHLFNKYAVGRPFVNPYVFAGIGVTSNNPKANYQGVWYELRPLRTEGVAYAPVVLVIPFGGGLAVHLSDSWDISLEAGYRLTFHDYLDDVSTTFPGVETFEDPIARALSDRRPEMGLQPRPAGSRRGNSTGFDGYFLGGIKLVYTPKRIPSEIKQMW